MAAIHGLTFCNEQLLVECKVGYCCHCGKTHKFTDYEFQHEPKQEGPGNFTAFCPDCGIDCVIPNIFATMLGKDIMEQFKTFWFG